MGSWATTEDMARNGLRAATGHILENVGFASISEDSLNLLTDVMRRFMVELWSKGKFYAEHAGRTNITPDDMTIAFRRLRFSSIEMHDYLQQIGNTGYVKPTFRFPFMKPNIRALYAPQPSEKELETRPEHIPRHFPAAHPEWTSEGADYLAVMKPSTSSDKKGVPAEFPDFTGVDAKSLGLLRREKKEQLSLLQASKDHSSATGIRSSANISSQKLQNNNIDLLSGTSPKKKVKPTGCYKDRLSYTPSPAPSPLPPLFIKRPDTVLSRAASPSPGVTLTISRKTEQKLSKIINKNNKLKKIPSVCINSPSGEASNISPMPKLERNFEYRDSSRPNTPRVCDGGSSTLYNPQLSSEITSVSYETSTITPYIKDDVIAANVALFTTIKEEAKKEKKHKEKKNKDKSKMKKQTDKEKKRIDNEKKEQHKQEDQKILLEKQPHQLADDERLRLLEINRDAPTPPMRQEIVQESPKHLKIVISNPHSDSASSAFSPPASTPRLVPVDAAVSEPTTISGSHPMDDDDSDTTPFFDDASQSVSEPLETTFPHNLGLEDKSSHKKKSKKKDKDRDRSPHRSKNKMKDKERKKKKKREREEKNEINSKQIRGSTHTPKEEHSEQKITLKIRLGDQTPSSSEKPPDQSPQSETPVKIKFKNIIPFDPKKKQEKVPPLRLGSMSLFKDVKDDLREEPKKKFYTKAELKAPPPLFSSSNDFIKQAKDDKKEKGKRKDEDRKRDGDERKRKEREDRELEKEREKEREREKDNERQREKEKEREKEMDQEREQQRENEKISILPPPITAFVKAEKKKDKKNKEKRRNKMNKKESGDQNKLIDIEKDEEFEDDTPEVWICPSCSVAWTEGATMVCCDMCDNWFHWHCVGLIVAPPDDVPWFCQKCAGKKQKEKLGKRLALKVDSAVRKKKRKF